MADAILVSKLCSACKINKPLFEFSKEQGKCKKCRAAKSREWAKNNPEKIKEKNAREYRQADKDDKRNKAREYVKNNKERVAKLKKDWALKNKERRALSNKNRLLANRDKIYKAQKIWRDANKEKSKISVAIWREKNRDLVAQMHRNRSARKRGAKGTHTAKDILLLLKLQKNLCPCCKSDVSNKYHVDHIVPLKLGGDNDMQNLQILCPSCNLKKNAKHPIDFMQSLGFLL